MTSETVVAVFDTETHADAAIRDLVAEGVRADAIEHYAQNAERAGTATGTADVSRHQHRGFWAWLTGEQEVSTEHHALYDRTIEAGGTVVTVIADDNNIDLVHAVLEKHAPVDLDDRHTQYRESGAYNDYPAYAGSGAGATSGLGASSGLDTAASSGMTPAAGTTATAGVAGAGAATVGRTGAVGGVGGQTEEVIGLSEETLEVGKRAVERGTTRVRRYVVERPVEEQIRLRNESVTVFRRPASGSTIADAFTDREIVMTETDEVPVVSKTAHVVEEVVVQKGVEERVETVRDTVRREDVEIEGGTGTPAVRPTTTDRI